MKKITLLTILTLALFASVGVAEAASAVRISGEDARLSRINISERVPGALTAHMMFHVRAVEEDNCLPKTGGIVLSLNQGGRNNPVEVALQNAEYLFDAGLDTAACGYVLRKNQVVKGLMTATFSTSGLPRGSYFADLKALNPVAGTMIRRGGLRSNSISLVGTSTVPTPEPDNAVLRVTSPNGGESFASTSSQTITWTVKAATGNTAYDIYLVCELSSNCQSSAASPYKIIATNTPHVGASLNQSFVWNLANSSIQPGRYKVRVCTASSNVSSLVNCDQSNNYFTVPGTGVPPVVIPGPIPPLQFRFTSIIPLLLGANTPITLSWSDSNPSNNYNLSLIGPEGGRHYIDRRIVAGTMASSSYAWTAGKTLAPQANLKSDQPYYLKLCRNNEVGTCVSSTSFYFATSTYIASNGGVTALANRHDDPQHPIGLAIDNNPDTYYQACVTQSTRYNNGSIIFDLGSQIQLKGINATFADTAVGTGPAKFTIDRSSTGENWGVVYRASQGGSVNPIDFTINPVPARYIRLNYQQVGDGTGKCLALKEFKAIADLKLVQ